MGTNEEQQKSISKSIDAAEPELPSDGDTVPFETVFASEIQAINARRQNLGQAFSSSSFQAPVLNETQANKDQGVLDAVGLSLSGGGVRSAAFCLGALQALDAALSDSNSSSNKKADVPSLFQRVDYLSTVSGGGYIGCSLTAGLSMREGKFQFESFQNKPEQDETRSIKHIRDHSNYLLPNGFVDVLINFVIYLRGLIANIVVILPVILALSVFTIYCSPTKEYLLEAKFYNEMVVFLIASLNENVTFNFLIKNIIGENIFKILKFENFGFTKLLFIFLIILFLLWGLISIVDKILNFKIWNILEKLTHKARTQWRRFWSGLFLNSQQNVDQVENYSEINSNWTKTARIALLTFLLCAFFELQPWILERLFDFAADLKKDQKVDIAGLNFWLQVGTVILTAIAPIVGFLADKLGKLTRNFAPATGWFTRAGRYSGRIAIYVASIVIPLTLWWVYLLFSFWGIESKLFPDKFAAPHWLFVFSGGFYNLKAILMSTPVVSHLISFIGHIPVIGNIGAYFGGHFIDLLQWVIDRTSLIAGVFIYFAVILFVLSLFPTLNANSLHQLYRDRLSAAFIFYEPLSHNGGSWLMDVARRYIPFWERLASWSLKLTSLQKSSNAAPQDTEPLPLDRFKLSQLSARFAPYHIINTALNIQGSKYVNQRARNADFFMLSRNYIGSEATRYVATTQMEKVSRDLNLATAMAVSGAAASPNMGSSTIRPLTVTLAILNIRLGYWLRNPIAAVGYANRLVAWIKEVANYYFFKEMLGKLNEKTHNVYLTDGGHIENLGIYELLKRRCKLIVAVDAEADPEMNFGSFVKLQRHARIDLGIRIELPWQAIRETSLSVGRQIAKGDDPRTPSFAACCETAEAQGNNKHSNIPNSSHAGPHCALGVIRYPKGEIGYLFYIKSSLTGDENDYVLDYKRRHPSFPHETTGDQLFSEEQFEVYRALAFHATHHAFTGKDDIAVLASNANRPDFLKWDDMKSAPLLEVRKILQI